MPTQDAAKPAPAATGNRLQTDRLASAIKQTIKLLSPAAQVIRAEIIGSNQCTAGDCAATGQAPVTALCRKLLAAGCDPDQPLEVFRGSTLALKVRSIGEGAALHVEDSRHGTPTFRHRQSGSLGVVAAPPIAPFRHPATTLAVGVTP